MTLALHTPDRDSVALFPSALGPRTMNQRLLVAFLALFVALPAWSQEAKDEELAFVQQLRARGYADLALEYLEKRLAKNPKYAADLPLEVAHTRLEMAGSEPDASKRIGLYAQAKTEFEDFVKKHPTHARISSAKLTIAQIAAYQGKAQLSRALAVPEGDDSRATELKQAKDLLEAAIKGLEDTANALNTDEAKNNAALERGQLMVSQARILYELKKDKDATDIIKGTLNLFEALSEQLKNADPLRPVVIAWTGRAFSMSGQPSEAKKKFQEALATNDRTAMRLVRYFDMLQTFEDEKGVKAEDAVQLIKKGQEWLIAYPNFRTTPEGFGVQYILARMYFDAGVSTSGVAREANWRNARALITRLEATDNEFSQQAQQLKINIFFEQKAFERDIKSLTTFDECYMRALYEHQVLTKNEKGKFEKEDDKKQQQKKIIDVLKRALDVAKGKNVNDVDRSNAYYLLTGYSITAKEYAEAAKAGEEFARTYPKAKQANLCAMFAAEALATHIRNGADDDFEAMPAERERLFNLGKYMAERWPGDKAGEYGRYLVVTHLVKKPVEGKTEQEKEAARQKREAEAVQIGGDVARFQLGAERAKKGKFLDAVKLLKDVKADSPNYTLSQYQLALAALQIQKENDRKRKENPTAAIDQLPGDKREFRDVAMDALAKIPDPKAGEDGDNTLYYLRAKIQLGFLYYSAKKYAEMDALAQKLAAAVEGLKGEAAMDKQAFQLQVGTIRLYGVYGKADDLYRAEKYAETVAILDPVVNELKAGKYPEIKENPALMAQVMGMALRSNMLVERVQRAKETFAVWNTLERDRIKQKTQGEIEKLEAGIKELEAKADKTDDDKKLLEQQKKQLDGLKGQGAAALAEEMADHRASVLQQTFAVMKRQIDEMRRKNEKEKLERTINAFSALLADEKGDDKSLKPGVRLLLAQCYASIHRFPQALDLLGKFPEPPKDADPKGPEVGRQRVAQVLQIRCHRLLGKENKDLKSLELAKKKLDEIMIDPKGPMGQGWGRRDINALKEEIELLIDMKAFGAAVNRCNALLAILGPKLREGGAMRDHYFEVAYFYVLAFTHSALAQDDQAKKDNYLSRSAAFYKKLLVAHPTMGGDEHKERFDTFIQKTPEGKELKKVLDTLKD
jgi:hypothetical protein